MYAVGEGGQGIAGVDGVAEVLVGLQNWPIAVAFCIAEREFSPAERRRCANGDLPISPCVALGLR